MVTILACLDIQYEVIRTNNFRLLYEEKVNFIKDLKGNKAIKIKPKQTRERRKEGKGKIKQSRSKNLSNVNLLTLHIIDQI